MWIKCPNGVDTIVNDPAHIARLLSEGGIAISDPTITLARADEGSDSVPSDTPSIPSFEDLSVIPAQSEEPEAKKRGRPPKSAQ